MTKCKEKAKTSYAEKFKRLGCFKEVSNDDGQRGMEAPRGYCSKKENDGATPLGEKKGPTKEQSSG